MRPLTEEETRKVFEKLANYIGSNIKLMIDRADEPYCFRIQRDRVYYLSVNIAKYATCVARPNLMSLGTCLGKFTKTGKFRLHVTAAEVLAKHARYKIWIKPNGEGPFLYGNNILKAHIGKMSEDVPEHVGMIVYSMNDTPLGFGVSAKSTAETRRLDPTAIVCYRQTDIGEYLRDEDSLFA